MKRTTLRAAKQLLQKTAKPEEIPVQAADFALDVSSLYVSHDHYFYLVEYLIYPDNLYLIFDGHATKDEHGNFNSPIFQKKSSNGTEPLWQKFRERFETEIGTSVSRVLFGDYRVGKNGDEFFTVKSEPKDCRWRYTKKPDKDSVYITAISKEQALKYQEILDELRLQRAIETIKDRNVATKTTQDDIDRAKSCLCREDAIITLNSKYPDEFDRFTFDPETFRFRQFLTNFLYTPEGLKKFDYYYAKVYAPYRDDEIADAEWQEKSRRLKNCLLEDNEFGSEFRLSGTHSFKITRLGNDRCKVESDLIDDRTGHEFNLTVQSQKFDDILDAVSAELTVVFQRKKQMRRATATLQSLASSR